MENPIHSNVLHELILEIILRLLLKTLLRFKCISAEWNTLIGSSAFANRHFNHASNQKHLLVRQKNSDDKEKQSFSLYVNDLLSKYGEPNHLQIPATIKNVMGPLNGVFYLINTFEEMAFLNPAMRQFFRLQLLPDLDQSSYINQSHLYFHKQEFGFGLNPSSGDYKHVSVEYFWDTENNIPYYPCIISVYNSSSDSWRDFEEVDVVNTYLNGDYYWLMKLGDDNHIVSILGFDMRSDKFREIEGAPNDIF